MKFNKLFILINCLFIATLSAIQTPNAAAQHERKNIRYGVSFEFPVNTSRVESINYDFEAFNTQYGNFCVKVFPLKDFYGKDLTIMKWVDRYSRDRKMWKNLDTTAKTILEQLTVLDNLNPVHSVKKSYKKVGKQDAYSIVFNKNAAGKEYKGECIGFLIPQKSLFVKVIHYMPEEDINDEAVQMQNRFFKSMKISN